MAVLFQHECPCFFWSLLCDVCVISFSFQKWLRDHSAVYSSRRRFRPLMAQGFLPGNCISGPRWVGSGAALSPGSVKPPALIQTTSIPQPFRRDSLCSPVGPPHPGSGVSPFPPPEGTSHTCSLSPSWKAAFLLVSSPSKVKAIHVFYVLKSSTQQKPPKPHCRQP